MAAPRLPEPVTFAGAFAYEHTDVPPGQTLIEWRRERAAQAWAAKDARRAERRRRLRTRLSLRAAGAQRHRVRRHAEPAR